MISKIEPLTRFIPEIQRCRIGERINDEKTISAQDHSNQIHSVDYSKLLWPFEDEVHRFVKENEDEDLTNYGSILKSHGLNWESKSMFEADASTLDRQTVLALIVGAVRAERTCDGALNDFFIDGSILRWLERLKDIETELRSQT